MAALREILAEFGIEVDDKKLEKADERVSGFIEKLKSVGQAVAGAFAIHEVFEFAESTARAIHAVEHNAQMLGISADAVQQLGYAARASGEDADSLVFAMGRLQVTAANAGKGTGQGAELFKKLGVSVKDASGHLKGADELFADVADGISKMKNPTERAAAATALFGRTGRSMLPFLSKGAAGLRELKEEFESLGGGFDEEAIEKTKKFEHGMAKIHLVVEGIKSAIVHGLFPPLTWLVDHAAIIGGWFVKMTKNTNIFRNALIMLAVYLTPLAISMALAFAPILLAGAALLLLIGLVDDLITMFEGGESVIGDVVDMIFGKGSSAELVEQVKEAWQSVKETFTALLPTVQQIYDMFKWIVEHSMALGDAIGQSVNRSRMEEAERTGDIKKGRGGLTYEQAALAKGTKEYLAHTGAGKDPSQFVPSETLPGMNRQQSVAKIQQSAGEFSKTAALPAGVAGPQGPPQINNNIEVTVQGTNAQPHEIKTAVAEGIREAQQATHRAAKHVLTPAGVKP